MAAALQAGLYAGEGSAAIAGRICKMSAMSPWRALTVALTETYQAVLFAQIETARQAERNHDRTLAKVWLATLDTCSRDTHRVTNGQAVPLREPFHVGGILMDRASDPSAPARVLVNCRCTMLMRPADPHQTS